ncbi:MAG: thioredoxin family protein [Ignavibacteriaceae bacterium]|jgi:thioredoxin-like negative regulator of GroEL
MLERIIALSFFLIMTYILVRRLYASKIISNGSLPFEIDNINPALPTIIYFWTEQCAQCNSVQKPVILKLKEEGNEFNFISYNAIKELDITKYLNIKTVPSTVVLNHEKKINYINSGYTAGKILKEQLNELHRKMLE